MARIFNGNLYYSASTAIYAFLASPRLPPPQRPRESPAPAVYDFAISPAGNVAYVADDSSLAPLAALRNGLSMAAPGRKNLRLDQWYDRRMPGLAVDFSGPNPVLYATTADSATKLITITDTSAFTDTSDTADQVTVLATASANYRFPRRGPRANHVSRDHLATVRRQQCLVGTTVNLSVTATGGQPLAYQVVLHQLQLHQLADGSSGYGGTISGSTTATLTIDLRGHGSNPGVIRSSSRTASGSITSRVAQVTIVAAPVPPTIDANISPIGSTNFVGDALSFSVTAHGVPAVAYQWKCDSRHKQPGHEHHYRAPPARRSRCRIWPPTCRENIL